MLPGLRCPLEPLDANLAPLVSFPDKIILMLDSFDAQKLTIMGFEGRIIRYSAPTVSALISPLGGMVFLSNLVPTAPAIIN